MSRDGDVWEVVRQLQSTQAHNEAMIARLRSDQSLLENEHRKQTADLKEEIDRLRGQLRKESDGSSAGATRS
jgi:hypothetical protein